MFRILSQHLQVQHISFLLKDGDGGTLHTGSSTIHDRIGRTFKPLGNVTEGMSMCEESNVEGL